MDTSGDPIKEKELRVTPTSTKRDAEEKIPEESNHKVPQTTSESTTLNTNDGKHNNTPIITSPATRDIELTTTAAHDKNTKEESFDDALDQEQPTQTLEGKSSEKQTNEVLVSKDTTETGQQNNKLSKGDDKKRDSLTYKLDFDKSNNFYNSFNKPGDCITKLFKNIKNDLFFTSYSNFTNDLPKDIQEIQVFKDNDKSNKIVSACYMYHFKQQGLAKKLQRLEIAVQGQSEAWVWMMASKPINDNSLNDFYLYFREFILKKEEGIWKVTLGHEGEMQDVVQSKDRFKLAERFEHHGHNQWFNIPENSCSKGCINKSLSLYWKPDHKSSKELVQLALNTGDQITRWGGENRKTQTFQKRTLSFPGDPFYPRKRIYYKNQWYTNPEDSNYNDKPLIKLKNKDVAKTKGKWNNLLNFCENDNNKTIDSENYKIYCH